MRKQSNLGTLDLVLGARHSGRKKEKIMGGVGLSPQGTATVKGRERGLIKCEVMRLDLGFRKVRREKGYMLTQDQYIEI